jgi:1-acyl-sn-glycerol-3-phosphate acyltransferase
MNAATVTRAFLFLLRTYFRIEVEGLEHLPRRGGALIAPNHSGFLGADAVLLAFVIKRETKRRARLLAHRAYFDYSKALEKVATQFGLRRAGAENGLSILQAGHLLVLFPEGEAGNFKSSLKRYRLQPFHTGFIRMAILSRVPIVPTVILGAEESNFALGNINLSGFVKGLRIPLPVNLFPLPAKWHIVLLPKVWPEELLAREIAAGRTLESLAADKRVLKRVARRVQLQMQREIRDQVARRPYIYSRRLSHWLERRKGRVKARLRVGLAKGLAKKKLRPRKGTATRS